MGTALLACPHDSCLGLQGGCLLQFFKYVFSTLLLEGGVLQVRVSCSSSPHLGEGLGLLLALCLPAVDTFCWSPRRMLPGGSRCVEGCSPALSNRLGRACRGARGWVLAEPGSACRLVCGPHSGCPALTQHWFRGTPRCIAWLCPLNVVRNRVERGASFGPAQRHLRGVSICSQCAGSEGCV